MQQPLMIAHPPSLDRISQLLGVSICINMSDSVLHQNQCKCAFCSSKYLVWIMDSFSRRLRVRKVGRCYSWILTGTTAIKTMKKQIISRFPFLPLTIEYNFVPQFISLSRTILNKSFSHIIIHPPRTKNFPKICSLIVRIVRICPEWCKALKSSDKEPFSCDDGWTRQIKMPTRSLLHLKIIKLSFTSMLSTLQVVFILLFIQEPTFFLYNAEQ